MYRDKTLIPTEAIRLCALGILAAGPKHYAELASEVRGFAGRIIGPSLDILGPSLELLRYEGLIKADPVNPDRANPKLRITQDGLDALGELMRAHIRAPVDDTNKLVIALKMRFMHLLDRAERAAQIESLLDLYESELARLVDLRGQECAADSYLGDWLDHEISQLESRKAWLTAYRERV